MANKTYIKIASTLFKSLIFIALTLNTCHIHALNANTFDFTLPKPKSEITLKYSKNTLLEFENKLEQIVNNTKKIIFSSKKKFFFNVLKLESLNSIFTNDKTGPNDDFDNDGIPNKIDLDDDNDGITDIEECGCESNNFSNGSFEAPSLNNNDSYIVTNQNNIPGWSTTSTDNNIEIWDSGFNDVPSQHLNQFAEINATEFAMLYQTFCVNGEGGTINWSLYHRGRERVDVAVVKIGTSLDNVLNDESTIQETMSDGADTWGFYSGSYIIPKGITSLIIGFEATSASSTSVGNFIDNIQIDIQTFCADTDKDGLSNKFDVDSDNDGCPDAIEGNGNFTLQDLTPSNNLADETNGEVDNNGIPTNPGSPQANNSEVTSAVNIAITTPLEDISICKNNKATFKITANATKIIEFKNSPPHSSENVSNSLTYQWLVSTNNGTSYNIIPEETSAELQIENSSLSMNNNRYKVIISHPEKECTLSDNAILTVKDDPAKINAPNAISIESCITSDTDFETKTGFKFSETKVTLTEEEVTKFKTLDGASITSNNTFTISYIDAKQNNCPTEVTRTYTITDSCNNSTQSDIQTITINDTTKPTASNPKAIGIQCKDDLPPPNINVVTDAADNCSTPLVSYIRQSSNGQSCPELITRTYSVTDACGNTIELSQTITINDTTKPTASKPKAIAIQCKDDLPPPNINVVTDAADNCSTPLVSYIGQTSNGQSCPELITRTYSVTDACGNTIELSQTITINDTTKPTASKPKAIAIQCKDDLPPPNINVVTDAADNCSTPLVSYIGQSSNGQSCPELITRIYSVTDACGNTIELSQTITINDTTKPTASKPKAIAIQCKDDLPPPNVNVVTDAADNCSTPLVSYIGQSSNGQSCPELITRTYSVTDACGNTIELSQTITINDTTKPTASKPKAIAIQCKDDLPPPNVNVVTDAADNCSTPLVSYIGQSSNGQSCPELITRTYSVTDACGNTIELSQTITINDTTKPTASNPKAIAIQCKDDLPPPNINVVTDAADNCSTPLVSYIGQSSNGQSCPELITRTYSVTDACGNTIELSQTITISDTTKPTASNPKAIAIQCKDDLPPPNVNVVTDAADNCSTPLVSYIGQSSNGQSCPELITRTYSVTDACGNTIELSQTITINDTTKPTASNPKAIAIQCKDDLPPPNINVVTDAADNCSTPLVSYIGQSSNGQSCPELITRTYSVTDACGNTIELSQTITINDTTKPTASNPKAIAIQCKDDLPPPNINVVTDAADNCSTPLVSYIGQSSNGQSCPELITRTYSVTDACGNTIELSQTITISDTTKPTASNPKAIAIQCKDDLPPPNVNVVTDAADNCSTPLVSYIGQTSNGQSCPELITRTYSVTDACGNTIELSQTITINDTTKPTASNPKAIAIQCKDDLPPPNINVVTDAADNCSTPLVSYIGQSSNGQSCPELITRTYSVTDACGNTIELSQTITINDTTKPTASKPKAIAIQCKDHLPPPNVNVVTDAADNCSTPLVSYIGQSSNGQSCPELITRTYSVTDACGNTIELSQTITINDTTKPTASKPKAIAIQCKDDLPPPNVNVVTDAADNCSTPLVSYIGQSSNGQSCPELITRTYSVTDACGNTIELSQTITINDTTKPTASKPKAIAIQCKDDLPPPNVNVVTDAADNCSTPLVSYIGQSSNGQSCPELITRTYSVTDACGNTIELSQTITINDTTKPTASKPKAIAIQCKDDLPPPNINVVTDAADNCSTPLVSYIGQSSNGQSCPELITRTYSVTDACGNTIELSQTITINDTTKPTASKPKAIAIQCKDDLPPPNINVVTDAADNCSTPLVSYIGQSSNGQSCPELITRIYSVTDACGNTIELSQTITINDTTKPTASKPKAIAIQCKDDLPPPNVNVVTDAADNCSTPLVSYIGQSSNGQSCPELITRTYSVTDACGNTIELSQTITINDTTKPTASKPKAIAIQCKDDLPPPNVNVVTDAADNCSTPLVSYIGQTSNGQSCPELITRTYSVTDACGNTIELSQTITINDTTKPTASNPKAIAIQCKDDLPPPNINVVTDAADNCSTPLVSYIGQSSNGQSCPELITRTYSVTDACGNTIELSQTITINDTTKPTASKPKAIAIQCKDDLPPPNINVVTDAADNCSTPLVSYIGQSSNGQSCPELITRTYSVTDACGNTIELSQTITINDTTKPTASKPKAIAIQCKDDLPPPNINVVTDAADNCSTPLVSYIGQSSNGQSCPELITRIYSVTDACGNTIELSQTITINDTTKPTASKPKAIAIQCKDDLPPPNVNVVTDAADNCSTPLVSYIGQSSNGQSCPELITRTYSVTDACGNTIELSQTITINDTTKPTASKPKAIAIQCKDDLPPPNVNVVTDAADNCSTPLVSYIGQTSNGQSCPELITRTYSVTDACGNTIELSQTITINDTTKPTASNPKAIAIQCKDDLPPPNINVVTDAADNCSTPLVSYIGQSSNGQSCPELITRTYSVTDACGNTIELSQTITINDTTKPTASKPKAIAIQCKDDLPPPNINVVTDAADNCSTPLVSYIGQTSNGQSCPELITRTYSVTDACGNTIKLSQTITINDTTKPTASKPKAIAIQCKDDLPPPNINVVTDAADNCSTPLVSYIGQSSNGQSCPELITRIYSVTDACGNTIELSQTITINDTTKPTASKPKAIAIQCKDDLPPPNVNVVTDAADNCSTPLVSYIGQSSNGQSCPELITRTYSVTDACGNTIELSQTITINDTTKPTASKPKAIAIQCKDDLPPPNVNVVTDAADNCSTPLVSYIGQTSNGQSCPELITRTYSVTDACGNTIELSQTITINDTTKPTASNPKAIAIQCKDDLPPPNINVVTDAADNCSTPLVSYIGQTSNGQSCPELITRTYSVTDACGNTIKLSQTITINDTTKPTASKPKAIAIQCKDDLPPPNINVVTDAADNCSTPLVSYIGQTSNGQSCPELITRTYSVTDACGNTIKLSQTITINDTTKPTTSKPKAIAIQCKDDLPPPNINVVTDAADNCSTPLVSYIGQTSNGQSCPELITRTYSVTDACGNTIKLSQTITINDTTKPTASKPKAIAIQCKDDLPPPNINVVTDAADNCSTPLVSYIGQSSNGQSCPELITRTYSVTDACGNTIELSQTITINDTTKPYFTTRIPSYIKVNCENIPDPPTIDAEDNCSDSVSIDFSTEIETITEQRYLIKRKWTAIDTCNNKTSIEQIIDVNTVSYTIIEENIELCTTDAPIDLNDLFSLSDSDWYNQTTKQSIHKIINPKDYAIGTYILTLNPNETCKPTAKIELTINNCTETNQCINSKNDLKIGTLVTPNNDGVNDTFKIEARGTQKQNCNQAIHLKLYNRWGNLIFESNDYKNDWFGQAAKNAIGESDKSPRSTYFYIIEIENSTLPPIQGYFLLGHNQ